ncbi:MAG: glycoside hydrolase family 16 protein [Bacteroidia bacterium]|nr:glycoside hydrolase family 16 protein [Bacteroidia bacterium]MBT8270321.1 glycoside hydrolase family 16 protein [Bacteroidia bacterium]NNK71364.1 glycoside hydrolase family 16 protein [Flavobacteriaceae bacterium]NNL79186.1 glycoside hydrolase family 16 protein [Flavobacteriaceae bacterium]
MKMIHINKLKIVSVLFIVLAFAGCTTDETQTVATFNTLVMADEFDNTGAPDPDMWTYNIGTGSNGWGNNELQYYTDRPENVIVEGGTLKITARPESFEGSGYTSARLITKGLFEKQYGRFEARIKMPFGQGIWPAFWMLGNDIDEVSWPQCGEIDIIENFGRNPTVITGAVHGPGYNAGDAIFKDYDLVNERIDTDFHIYGIEWGPNYINYYVDDVLYNQITPEDVPGEWVFDHPFFMILNVAVGGNAVGSPNETTQFPQTMYVDYIRVYE